ncbi:MAG: VCBS repeat-containing protein [Planctomycetota bacterium]
MTERGPIFICAALILWITGCTSVDAVWWREERGPTRQGRYQGLVVADLNRDEYIDIITTEPENDAVIVFLGTPGRWQARELTAQRPTRSVAVGDLDRDRNLDIVVTTMRSVEIWIGDGQGGFESQGELELHGEFEDVSLADLDGNGWLDIILADNSPIDSSGILVCYALETLRWSKPRGPRATESFADIEVVDVDGDGALDLLGAASSPEGGAYYWRNDRNGGWHPSIRFGDSPVHGVCAADVDGDGRSEIVSARAAGGLVYYDEQPDGRWEENCLTDVGRYWRVSVGTVTSDSIPDIIATSIDSHDPGLHLWIGEGEGEFRRWEGATPAGGAAVYYDLFTGDIDRDGLLDVAATNWSEAPQLWLTRGMGFTPFLGSGTDVPYGSPIDEHTSNDLPEIEGTWPRH